MDRLFDLVHKLIHCYYVTFLQQSLIIYDYCAGIAYLDNMF